MLNRGHVTGFLAGIAAVWIYHHFIPGKGIGQPGSVG